MSNESSLVAGVKEGRVRAAATVARVRSGNKVKSEGLSMK